MKLNVTPQEVEAYARKLHEWSNQIRNLHSQIKGSTQNLQQHWNDPQFNMYAEVIAGHNTNLEASIKSFEEISRTLQKMSRSMAENVQQQQQMIEALRRR